MPSLHFSALIFWGQPQTLLGKSFPWNPDTPQNCVLWKENYHLSMKKERFSSLLFFFSIHLCLEHLIDF